MPRRPTGKTFVARARVNLPRWERFDAAAEAAGTDRSKLINEFIAWYLRERGSVLPERPTKEAVTAVEAERPDLLDESDARGAAQ